jgi:CHASE3 domain sensor protein
MPELDLKQLVGELASQHGIRVDANDPAIAIVLLNRLVLQHTADELAKGVRVGLREFEEAVQKVQTRSGQLVAAEFNHRAAALRSELQRDITLAGAKASEIVFRVEQANRQPVMLRWATLGIVVALALFLIGLWIGAHYMHV